MGNSPLREELRVATQSGHAALELLVGDEWRLADYARYLRSMHAFSKCLSASLALHGHAPCFLAERLQRMESDLRALDLTPLPAPPPIPISADGYWGARYVVEGASLGARVLARRLLPLGLSPERGARFVVDESLDRAHWPAFLAALEGVPPAAHPAAIGSAIATFDLAHRCFRLHDQDCSR